MATLSLFLRRHDAGAWSVLEILDVSAEWCLRRVGADQKITRACFFFCSACSGMSHETNYIAGQRAQQKKNAPFFAPHVLERLLDEWHFKQEKKHAEQKTRATKKHAEPNKKSSYRPIGSAPKGTEDFTGPFQFPYWLGEGLDTPDTKAGVSSIVVSLGVFDICWKTHDVDEVCYDGRCTVLHKVRFVYHLQ